MIHGKTDELGHLEFVKDRCINYMDSTKDHDKKRSFQQRHKEKPGLQTCASFKLVR